MRPTDAVDDGKAHVGPAKLGDAGCVLCFDHGVDDGLGMNDNVNIVVACAEEVVGFNDLFLFCEVCMFESLLCEQNEIRSILSQKEVKMNAETIIRSEILSYANSSISHPDAKQVLST